MWSQLYRTLSYSGQVNVKYTMKCQLCQKVVTTSLLNHNVPRGVDSRSVSFWSSSNVTAWSKAVSEAEKIVGYPTSFMSLRCLLSDELSNVAMQMRKLVGTKHPLLKTARKFFYDGKHSMQTRGLLVLLMSKTAGPNPSQNDELESMVSGIYPRQRSLAEIIEMINTANLIHKGVVNLADLEPADGNRQDMHFGNKMSVLSGDFLLANASTGLAELNNTYVVEIVSSAIGDLMEAAFVNLCDNKGHPVLTEGATIEDWEHHTYLSSGSLIAKSCKAAMMLAGHGDLFQQRAFQFGKHTSLAHQLHEDITPFIGKSDNGIGPNVASAPMILYAAQHPKEAAELGLLNNSSVNQTLMKKLVVKSGVLDKAKQHCQNHGKLALEALKGFEESDAKLALTNIVEAITKL